MTPLDRIARYIVITLVWVGALAVILGVIWSRVIVMGILGMVILLITLAAAVAATYVFKPPTDLTRPQKAKRVSVEPSALDILTPEDIDDLRADVKQHLREKMIAEADGEISSLDKLLVNQNHRDKRKS